LSEFLADEAAESDDDDKFGFAKVRSKDDDEDGEDMDRCLDVLMDDGDMDEDTVAADLVHEKFKCVGVIILA
jgi:mediator of replication checkpoint protein 1